MPQGSGISAKRSHFTERSSLGFKTTSPGQRQNTCAAIDQLHGVRPRDALGHKSKSVGTIHTGDARRCSDARDTGQSCAYVARAKCGAPPQPVRRRIVLVGDDPASPSGADLRSCVVALSVHVGFLVGMRNRVMTMTNWFWAYLTFGVWEFAL
jgi:hypothetical protein